MDTIRIKRGPKSRLPQHASVGELLYCTDTNELFIGQGEGVLRLSSEGIGVKVTDFIANDTEKFRLAIKEAYNRTTTNKGWRSPSVVHIPSGDYYIDDTILDELLGVPAGRFIFRGEGWQNTRVRFNPEVSKTLFDNKGIIGFCQFEGIQFISNGKGIFMEGVGGGTGNAQSFIFTSCSFSDWLTIVESSGNTMMSEVTFRDCKISGGTSSSVFFRFNNSQAVNWRFYSTDIESFSGTVFECLKGTSISYFQGSVIPMSGTILSIPDDADINAFGPTNSPTLQMYGVRFELRDKSYLINCNKPSLYLHCSFVNCGLGGYNLVDDREFYTLNIKSKGYLSFISCNNFGKIRILSTVQGSSDYLDPLKIYFTDCSDVTPLLKQSKVVYLNSPPNVGSAPLVVVRSGYGDMTVRLDGTSYYKYPQTILKRKVSFSSTLDWFCYCDRNGKTVLNHDILYSELISLKFVNKANPAYGSLRYKISFYNTDRSKLIGEKTFTNNIKDSLLIDDIYEYFGSDDKLIIEIEPEEKVEGNFYMKGFLILEY